MSRRLSGNGIGGLWRPGVALLLAALAGLGCRQDLRTTPLTPSRTPFVRDVPVPISFELVNALSRSYRTNGFRMVRHSYWGQAAPVTVYAFYRDQMPRNDWQLLSEQHMQGAYHLAFSKGEETATVVVAPERRALRSGALATVTVQPARAGAPAEIR